MNRRLWLIVSHYHSICMKSPKKTKRKLRREGCKVSTGYDKCEADAFDVVSIFSVARTLVCEYLTRSCTCGYCVSMSHVTYGMFLFSAKSK